jgi:hypothetical protein
MRELQVARTDWAAYFAALSALGAGARTTVQVLPDGSAEPQRSPTRWVLRDCRYDDGGDLLELTLLGTGVEHAELRCFVAEPRQICARESQLERSILVRDAAGVRTLVRVRHSPDPSRLSRGLSSWRIDRPAAGRLRVGAKTQTGRLGAGRS